jgi:hypothetical protein
VWVGLEKDEIVSGHLRADQRKLRNVMRDPRFGHRPDRARTSVVSASGYSGRLVVAA